MSSQEMKLEKVKKSFRVTKILTKIVAIVNCVFGGLCGIGAIACFLNLDKLNQFIADNPNVLNGHFESNGILQISGDVTEMAAEGAAAQGLAIYLGLGLVVCAFIAAVFFLLSRVLVKMETSESPFNREFMSPLKKIFIVSTIVMFLFVDTIPAIFLALLFWCIYRIFDYGCVLQEEVDDTV